MKTRTTKKALVLSFFAMLLCCAMLIGTTYAWFTDEVKSGNNKILAGNLDVEAMVDTDDGPVSLDDQDLKLFDVALWEPGVVAFETIEVSNVGNLALKYNLYLNVSGMNSLNGKTLADVIKVAVVAGELGSDTTRTGLINAIKDDLKPINVASALVKERTLLPGETDNAEKFTIVLYWEPTDHDNDYNVNNGQSTDDDGDALYIDFSVVLTATQEMHESDGFGIDYDAEAKLGGIPAVTEAINKGAADCNDALETAIGDSGLVYFDDDLVYEADGVVSIVLHFDTPESKGYVTNAFDAISDLIVTAVDEEAANIYSIEIGAGLPEKLAAMGLEGVQTYVRVLDGKPVEYTGDQPSWLYEDLAYLMKQVVSPGASMNETLQACLEFASTEGLDVKIVAKDGGVQIYRMYFDLNWLTPVEQVTEAITEGAKASNEAINAAIEAMGGEAGLIWFDEELTDDNGVLAATLHFEKGSFDYVNVTYEAVKALIGEAVYEQAVNIESIKISEAPLREVNGDPSKVPADAQWVEDDLRTVMEGVSGGLRGALEAAQQYGLEVVIKMLDGTSQTYRMDFDINW